MVKITWITHFLLPRTCRYERVAVSEDGNPQRSGLFGRAHAPRQFLIFWLCAEKGLSGVFIWIRHAEFWSYRYLTLDGKLESFPGFAVAEPLWDSVRVSSENRIRSVL